LPAEQRADCLKSGRGIFGVKMPRRRRGRELPRDGGTFGHLRVRAHGLLAATSRMRRALDADGYLRTGDIAVIDRRDTLR
jgi:hypothetical protein